MTIPALPPRRSLSGHDAYCHVCWEDFYALWVAPEAPPNHLCPLGAKSANECSNAMSRARTLAFLRSAAGQSLDESAWDGASPETSPRTLEERG